MGLSLCRLLFHSWFFSQVLFSYILVIFYNWMLHIEYVKLSISFDTAYVLFFQGIYAFASDGHIGSRQTVLIQSGFSQRLRLFEAQLCLYESFSPQEVFAPCLFLSHSYSRAFLALYCSIESLGCLLDLFSLWDVNSNFCYFSHPVILSKAQFSLSRSTAAFDCREDMVPIARYTSFSRSWYVSDSSHIHSSSNFLVVVEKRVVSKQLSH